MVVTLGQQYDIGEEPTVILYTYIINRHAMTPKPQSRNTVSLGVQLDYRRVILKKNQNAPRPSEHPPVGGKKCQNV